MRLRSLWMIAACACWLGGCASGSREAIANNDPLEPFNRAVYRFDRPFDHYVVLPVASLYIQHMPAPVHDALQHFFLNLDLPVAFANQLLQGKFSIAGTTLARFTLNTTMGLGGFIDLATRAGLPYHTTDFGATLAQYGLPEGPFLVLPIVGPDPPRELIGDIVDLPLDPLFYLPPAAPLAQHVAIAVGERVVSPFEDHARNIFLRRQLEQGSVDSYATMRSTYRQQRADELDGGLPPIDDSSAGK